VEGYRKGLYADFMMRESMESVQKEETILGKRKAELERQLDRSSITEDQENRIRALVKKVSTGFDFVSVDVHLKFVW